MIKILLSLTLFFFFSFAIVYPGITQNNVSETVDFGVHRLYPYITISKQELNDANSIEDINKQFTSAWVRNYISVEVSTIVKGKLLKSSGKSQTFNGDQKRVMYMADSGQDVMVKLKYIPENSLKNNTPKAFDFTFKLDTDEPAQFPGGEEALKNYLKTSAIDKIPVSQFIDYDLVILKFTINEEGAVSDAHIFGSDYQTSRQEKIEHLLLETICNMPNWKPAEYSNGTKAKQEFVLTVGNMENCTMNLLNIRQDGIPWND